MTKSCSASRSRNCPYRTYKDLDGAEQILRALADAGEQLAELLAERKDLDGAEQIRLGQPRRIRELSANRMPGEHERARDRRQAAPRGEMLDIGGKLLHRQVRQINTPHVPHNWEAQLMFEQATATLLCGDLFTHLGNGPPVVPDDLVEPALDTEAAFRATSSLAATCATLRDLARLAPSTLAIMHGSSFTGDGAAALAALADGYEKRFAPETSFATNRGVLTS